MLKNLTKLKFEDVYEKLEKDEFNPYQFYNIDLGYDQIFATEHYLNNQYDNIETVQKIKKVFFDIELFQDHQIGLLMNDVIMQGKHLVNAISHYYSSENTFYAYLVPPKGFNITEKELEDFLFSESTKKIKVGENKDGSDKIGSYLEDGQKIKVKLFDTGIDLVVDFWKKIKENDPAVYSGWNSDGFDTPYLYHYLLHHFKDHQKVADIMSNFGEVEIDDSKDRAGNSTHRIRIADYNNLDLMYCYKQRADGGLGLGKKLMSYALDNVAFVELGLRKLNYKQENMTLDQFYEKDPKNFLLYNLWDTVLAYKIDNQTGMIDLYNMQRRKMRTPLSSAIRGSSPLFDTYIYSVLKGEGKCVRWGINSESNFEVSEKYIKEIPQIKTQLKINWNVKEISTRECGKLLSRIPGAYVKPPKPGIYDSGTISDLDASRLYPSMINQYNIGIDTFFGRLIPPWMDSSFNFFKKFFGNCTPEKLSETVIVRLMEESERFVENILIHPRLWN